MLEFSDVGNNKNAVMPYELRVQVILVVRNQSKLSSRLKSLFKTVNGASGQLGNKAWEAMQSIEAEFTVSAQLDSPKKVQELSDALEAIGNKESITEWEHICDELAAYYDSSGDYIRQIGDTFSGAKGHNSIGSPQLQTFVGSLLPSIFDVFSKLFAQTNGLAEFTEIVFRRNFHNSDYMNKWLAIAQDEELDLTQDVPPVCSYVL